MSEFIDFQNLTRPKSPNTYLVAPGGFTSPATADEVAPVFERPRMAIFDQIVGLAMERKGWTLEVADEATGRLKLVATSRLLRFRDDIDIVVLPVEGVPTQSTIAIYSRSRVGRSDFGVNRKRVTELLATLSSH